VGEIDAQQGGWMEHVRARRWTPRRISLCALLVLAAGCPAFTSMGTARTLSPGSSQTWVSAGVYRTTLVSGTPPGTVERSEAWLPLVEAGLRFGLVDRLDLTLRAGTGGGALEPRIQLLRSATVDSGVDLLLVPSIGWTSLFATNRDDVVSGVAGGLALPIGLNLGDGSQLVATPRISWVSDALLGGTMLAGGSLGLVLHVGGDASRPWYVIPECGVAGVSGGGRSFDGPVVQCALGLAGPGWAY